jgi:hypothetical protein
MSVKERLAFLSIVEAFPALSLDEVRTLIRDAFRGMYNERRS